MSLPDDACCATCVFFSPNPRAERPHGQCRFRPPVLDMAAAGPRTIWPLVRYVDWCGEHAVLDPNPDDHSDAP